MNYAKQEEQDGCPLSDAELDALVEEQRKNLPKWWHKERSDDR